MAILFSCSGDKNQKILIVFEKPPTLKKAQELIFNLSINNSNKNLSKFLNNQNWINSFLIKKHAFKPLEIYIDSKEPKYKINKPVVYLFFLISLGLLPRLNSYNSFIDNKNIALFNPQVENNISIDISSIQWEQPIEADRCWINLNCRFEEGSISITKENFFYVATKD